MSNAFGSEVCWWVVLTEVQYVTETVTIVVESQKSLLQTMLNIVEGKLATIAISLRALSMGSKRQGQTMSNAFKVNSVHVLCTLEFNMYWKLLQFMLTEFSVLKANLVSHSISQISWMPVKRVSLFSQFLYWIICKSIWLIVFSLTSPSVQAKYIQEEFILKRPAYWGWLCSEVNNLSNALWPFWILDDLSTSHQVFRAWPEMRSKIATLYFY